MFPSQGFPLLSSTNFVFDSQTDLRSDLDSFTTKLVEDNQFDSVQFWFKFLFPLFRVYLMENYFSYWVFDVDRNYVMSLIVLLPHLLHVLR